MNQTLWRIGFDFAKITADQSGVKGSSNHLASQQLMSRNTIACSIAVGLLFLLPQSTSAQRGCKKQPIEALVKAIGESFENKTLATLDAGRPYIGRFRIVIEHSLSEDDDPQRFERRSFRSLAQGEAWLKRREHGDGPGRATKPLIRCARGVCTYNFDSGIVHNVLFLKRITYGIRNGCPYLKTIHLLDGD